MAFLEDPLSPAYPLPNEGCEMSLLGLFPLQTDERLLGRTRGRSRVVSARPGADMVLLGVVFSLSNLKDV